MRRFSSILAIITALSGALGFVGGFSQEAALTSGIFALALLIAGIGALRGGALIYLATAWGVYLGTNLAAYVEVLASNTSAFASALLTALLSLGLVGLLTALTADKAERLRA